MKKNFLSGSIYGIFLFVLVFAPVAFGTVESWSIAIMEISALSALFLLLINHRFNKLPFYDVPGILPLILLLCYMLAQLAPAPSFFIKAISPETYSIYDNTIWAYDRSLWGSISIHKKATVSEFFRFASYAAIYILTVQVLSDGRYLKRTIVIVLLLASLLSLVGIVQYYSSDKSIYWMRGVTDTGSPFGPFVNPNHYAGFMGMVFPLSLCLFMFYMPDFWRGTAGIFKKGYNRAVLLGLASLLIGTSMVLTRSKGGMIGLVISLLILSTCIFKKEIVKRKMLSIILISVLLILCVSWFGWDPVVEKFSSFGNVQNYEEVPRVDIWKDSVDIIMDFPITGSGFGNYVHIYPKYRSLQEVGIVDHAHNDYLELLSDGGIVGGLLFSLFVIAVLKRTFDTLRKRRNIYSIYMSIAAFAGIAYVFSHGLFDFNLYIGSNGLYFFFLLGLAVSASHTRFQDKNVRTYLQRNQSLLSNHAYVLIGIVLFLSLVFNAGVLISKYFYTYTDDLRPNSGSLNIRANTAEKASFFDPLEPEHNFVIAEGEWDLNNRSVALAGFRSAVRLDPLNSKYLQALGLAYSQTGELKTADTLLRSGAVFDRRNPARSQLYASWLLSHNRKEEGINYMKKAISRDPENTGVFITTMVLNRVDDMDMQRAIPQMLKPHILFADYLSETGNNEMAAYEYRLAIDFADNAHDLRPSYFLRPYEYLSRKEMYGNALDVMKKAAKLFPKNVKVRLKTAEAYESTGQVARAVQEYKQALVIDPDNKRAKKRLEKLK